MWTSRCRHSCILIYVSRSRKRGVVAMFLLSSDLFESIGFGHQYHQQYHKPFA